MIDSDLEKILADAQKRANRANFPISVWHYERLRGYSADCYLYESGRFICSVAPQLDEAQNDKELTAKPAA